MAAPGPRILDIGQAGGRGLDIGRSCTIQNPVLQANPRRGLALRARRRRPGDRRAAIPPRAPLLCLIRAPSLLEDPHRAQRYVTCMDLLRPSFSVNTHVTLSVLPFTMNDDPVGPSTPHRICALRVMRTCNTSFTVIRLESLPFACSASGISMWLVRTHTVSIHPRRRHPAHCRQHPCCPLRTVNSTLAVPATTAPSLAVPRHSRSVIIPVDPRSP